MLNRKLLIWLLVVCVVDVCLSCGDDVFWLYMSLDVFDIGLIFYCWVNVMYCLVGDVFCVFVYVVGLNLFEWIVFIGS